jgi:hypothetical protein
LLLPFTSPWFGSSVASAAIKHNRAKMFSYQIIRDDGQDVKRRIAEKWRFSSNFLALHPPNAHGKGLPSGFGLSES